MTNKFIEPIDESNNWICVHLSGNIFLSYKIFNYIIYGLENIIGDIFLSNNS